MESHFQASQEDLRMSANRLRLEQEQLHIERERWAAREAFLQQELVRRDERHAREIAELKQHYSKSVGKRRE